MNNNGNMHGVKKMNGNTTEIQADKASCPVKPAGPSAPRGHRVMLRRLGSRRGSAMVMAVVFTAIVGSTVSYVMLGSNRQTRNTFRARLMDTSLAASAAIVKSMSQQAYYVAMTRPAQMEGDFSKLDELITNIQPQGVPGYTAVKYNNKHLISLDAESGNGEFSKIEKPGDDWNGFTIRRWSYDAVAFVNAADPDNASDIDATAKRLGFEGAGFKSKVEINYIPLYMYAIFYDKDLEFHPGADMSVTGPVHTNSTLWAAVGSGKKLDFHDRVSAAGSFRSYRDFLGDVGNSNLQTNIIKSDGKVFKPESADHPGNITLKNKNGSQVGLNNDAIKNLGMDTNNNLSLDSKDTNWLNSALARFGGNLADKSMGTKPIQPPLPFTGTGSNRKQADPSDLIQRVKNDDPADLKAVKMESMADILIEGDPTATETTGWGSNRKTVFKDNAVKIRPAIINEDSGLVTGYGSPISNEKDGKYIVNPGEFEDYRENKTVKSFDIDMDELKARTDVSNKIKNGNGVIYVSTDASKDTNSQIGAVRLRNADSSLIKKNGDNTLTVATDRPMYLEGNVNKDKSATLLLAADAMTILSKHLDKDTDMNSNASGNTETNAIFMLGQVSSKYAPVKDNGRAADGVAIDSKEKVPVRGQESELDHHAEGHRRFQWSGGVHNVMRYLENWGGKKHTYNGSLICLFESKIATARHQTGSDNKYYGAPNRSYNWDASLKNKVPPRGMPVLIEVKQSPLERISKAEAVALVD